MNTIAFEFDIRPGDRHSSVSAVKAFLRQFGYLANGAVTAPDVQDVLDGETVEALRRFQNFYGLPVTGEIDRATGSAMNKPRCGRADIAPADVEGRKWTRNSLTFAIGNTPTNLTRAQVLQALRDAMALWEQVTPLSFREVGVNDGPDIRIRFARGNHGDDCPFNGPGNTIGYGYYPPPNNGDLAGDIHFDDDETWSVVLPPPAGAYDLVNVAAHELGHALGLTHSSITGAIMVPNYPGPQRSLAPDDITFIRSIYGAEGVDKVGTIGETGWPGVWSNLEAALIHPLNGKAYFFRGNQYQRFDFTSPERVDKVGTIGESGWPGVWSSLDAALIHPLTGKAYFFRGNQYQRFDFTSPERVDKVGTIGQGGWPGVWSNLDAALIHPLNGKAYFFRGNQYQRFDFTSPERVDKVGTIGQSGWPGVWSNLESALIHPLNRKAYFFRGNQYQRFKFAF